MLEIALSFGLLMSLISGFALELFQSKETDGYEQVTFDILLVLMIATVLLAPGLGVIYGIISLSLTFIFIGFTWRLLKQDGIGFAKATYLFSLAYLAILFLAVIIEGSLQ